MDSSTIIAALVHGLTGSPLAVGAASAILRYGWLFPQLFVAYFAQRRGRRMPFYILGAFGRATCLAALAGLLALAGGLPDFVVITAFFGLWTLYAFVSGIVAVPYNDIVARSVASARRSRLLAVRFFGGGLLALGVAAIAHQLFVAFPFPRSYAALVFLGAVLLYVSSVSFVSSGEPRTPPSPDHPNGFAAFVRQGVEVFRTDDHFRFFVYSQWLGGAVIMALPFYILQATELQATSADVALLLGAQTTGALVSNALWGWWGDHLGKRSLLEGVAILRTAPPILTLAWVPIADSGSAPTLVGFALIFLFLGALGNGITIAMLGYLMEISPDDRRPAYSGYFNALVAPAALLPVAGAIIVETMSLSAVFGVSLVAAVLQYLTVRRLRSLATEDSSA
ncbi:MAG: MFS transporter [Alphaproteobacteria bacterium]